jgi:hypothetical protein
MDKYELVPTIQYVKDNLSKDYVVIFNNKGFAQPISFKDTDFNKEATMRFESNDFIDEFNVNYVLHIYGKVAEVFVTQILLDSDGNPILGKRTMLGKLYTVKPPAKGGKRKTRRRKQSKRKISRRR